MSRNNEGASVVLTWYFLYGDIKMNLMSSWYSIVRFLYSIVRLLILLREVFNTCFWYSFVRFLILILILLCEVLILSLWGKFLMLLKSSLNCTCCKIYQFWMRNQLCSSPSVILIITWRSYQITQLLFFYMNFAY